jgi:hypothetical protein
MPEQRERYRRLPGRSRGFVKGSSVWLGPDHLLLVNSTRFREDYKRFHLRDIQAIVVAEAPRFAVSTPAAGVALLWLIVYAALRLRGSGALPFTWIAGLGILGWWVYVCAARSCVCRIFTAVSRDELPSVYRLRTARRFLAQLQPLVWQAQGVLDGNWAEAMEERTLGPGRTGEPLKGAIPRGTRSRTPVSDVFIASLFGSAILNLATLHSLTRPLQWIWYGLALAEVAAAIVIFFQHHRGILRSGMQWLAVAALLAMGAFYYARTAIGSVISASNQLFPDPTAFSSIPAYVILRQIDAALCVLLGTIGVGLAVRER